MLSELLLGHIIGDFYLQTDKMSKMKNKNILFLLAHSFIVSAITFILLYDINLWSIAITIFITHAIIDIIQKYQKNTATNFIINQIAHICVLLIICYLYKDFTVHNIITIIIGYSLMLKPSDIFIEHFISKINKVKKKKNDLEKYIGYTERILTMTFILYNKFECVGLLLIAKSIFCYSHSLTDKENKIDYYLLGTFISICVAVCIATIIIRCL